MESTSHKEIERCNYVSRRNELTESQTPSYTRVLIDWRRIRLPGLLFNFD